MLVTDLTRGERDNYIACLKRSIEQAEELIATLDRGDDHAAVVHLALFIIESRPLSELVNAFVSAAQVDIPNTAKDV